MNPEPAISSPYRGLRPFTEADWKYYFGREQEQDLVIANVLASRLTVLFGPSGVGKSSVLMAGVVRQLQQEVVKRRDDTEPATLAAVFSSWRLDPILGIQNSILDAVDKSLGLRAERVGSKPGSLGPFLEGITKKYNLDLVVILDQFEEFFTYRESQSCEFASELASIINAASVPVNFLFSIREDAISELDRFKPLLPGVFDNILRVGHLDRAAAARAIVNPLKQYNLDHPDPTGEVEIETSLVEAVLDQVQIGEVALGGVRGYGGLGGGQSPDGDVRIETPYLQLVMTQLWNEEVGHGSKMLRYETLERLGGAERIVRTHFENALNSLPYHQQRIAAAAFRHLVTPSGTKIALAPEDLEGWIGIPRQSIEAVLEKLTATDFRILQKLEIPARRSKPRGDESQTQKDASERERQAATAPGSSSKPQYCYQIEHDVLAPAVLAWRQRFELTRVQRWLRRALVLLRNQRTYVTLGLVLVWILSGDAGAALPGGVATRKFIDNYRMSIFRRPPAPIELATVAADSRQLLFKQLVDGHRYLQQVRAREHEVGAAWIPFSLKPVDIQGRNEDLDASKFEPWASSQAVCAAVRAPEASVGELRPLIAGLDKAFENGPWRIKSRTTDYGWAAHPDLDYPEAEPALWTAAALAATLGRPGLVAEADRPKYLGFLREAQQILDQNYHPIPGGGWNMFPRQEKPQLHSQYSSALALLALLEAHKAGLPWNGSAARRDKLLKETADWLQAQYDADNIPPGWHSIGEEQTSYSDALTLQIYATLMQAESEAKVQIRPAIERRIQAHLAELSQRPFNYPDDRGEFKIPFAILDPAGGTVKFRGREIIGYLWYPWAIDCSQRWLERARKRGAPTWMQVEVERSLGHLVVDLRDDSTRNPHFTFKVAELLYCLSSIPPASTPRK